jgi:hypothetical protein
MSDSERPKFEVIDRRKMKAAEEAEHEQESPAAPAVEPETSGEPKPGPRLVVSEGHAVEEEAAEQVPPMPPAPSADEVAQQKTAYAAASQRLEDLVRAQNPGAEPPPPITFESLVQQFYVSAMIQMGAGTPEGQRPRIDILGARNTIDLLGILAEKTRESANETEARMLDTVLFDVRQAFLELSNMVQMQAPPPPPEIK